MRVYESGIISADSEGSFIEERKSYISRSEFFSKNPTRLICTESETPVYYLLDGLIYYTESDYEFSPVVITGMRPAEIFGENWKEFYKAG
jgi:hypothetical protein